MKPAHSFASTLFLLLFFGSPQAIAIDALQAPLEQCLKEGSFDATFSRSRPFDEAKVSQNQCRLKFVVFQGKGEKLELNLCEPEISINTYTSIDSPDPIPVKAGSSGCPQTALFGADFGQQTSDKERFEKEKAKILGIFADALRTYGKDVDLKSTGGKLICAKRLTKQYLEECKALNF